MSIHYTMGGIRINELAQAMRADGRPVAGLWAAGEATGGIHGKERLGGNGINDAVVFGRIAGQQAARDLLKHLFKDSAPEYHRESFLAYDEQRRTTFCSLPLAML